MGLNNLSMNDKQYNCPKCGSSKVLYRQGTIEVGSSTAECEECKWSGPVNDLVETPFHNPFGNADATATAFMKDVVQVVGEFTLPFGRFLMKWGFITRDNMRTLLPKYMAEIARAVAKTVVEVRQEQGDL